MVHPDPLYTTPQLIITHTKIHNQAATPTKNATPNRMQTYPKAKSLRAPPCLESRAHVITPYLMCYDLNALLLLLSLSARTLDSTRGAKFCRNKRMIQKRKIVQRRKLPSFHCRARFGMTEVSLPSPNLLVGGFRRVIL